jgi:1-acyl-sn-glycerol-3-phosphate acyltransferase
MPLIEASHLRSKAIPAPAQDRSSGIRWSYLLQIASIGLFFGIGLLVCPVCWLVAKLSRGKCPPEAGQAILHALFRFYRWAVTSAGVFRIEVDDPEAFHSLKGTIIAANHPSLVDAVFILSMVPRAICVMRADLMKNPMLGGAALLAGYVTNDSGPALIRQSMEKIGQGENLLIFPEGTRTRTSPVNPFKKGFAYIAERTGAPIQTVFLERFGPYLSKGTPLFSRAGRPICITIRLGAVIRPLPGETCRELASRLEGYFEEHLENTGEDVRLRKLPAD